MHAHFPDESELGRCLSLLASEQRALCAGAGATTLFSWRLRQRLTALKRRTLAVGRRAKPEPEPQPQPAARSEAPAATTTPALAPAADRATHGLAKLGSRAALSFAFAFLRRAWRSGE